MTCVSLATTTAISLILGVEMLTVETYIRIIITNSSLSSSYFLGAFIDQRVNEFENARHFTLVRAHSLRLLCLDGRGGGDFCARTILLAFSLHPPAFKCYRTTWQPLRFVLFPSAVAAANATKRGS